MRKITKLNTRQRVFLIPLFLLPLTSQANISLDQSRVIFESSQKSQMITIQNDSEKTYLIQARVQNNNIDGPNSDSFLIVPPLFRLEANSQHAMKLIPQDTQSLPKDRESVFYFSATAIPATKQPTEQSQDTAKLSIATRLVIKLFYRPQGLTMSYEQAVSQLQFTASPQGTCFINPTPYYITVNKAWSNGVPLSNISGLMLAPKSAQLIKSTIKSKQINLQAINDYGGITQHYQYSIVSGEKTCRFVD
ncbi:fimbrial biogenesis chaperone [Pragia fontium]|uniref:Fimbrial chaperone protein n=4 Tax=Pragia fontium TaxID=82985 RepID=A0AAJ5BIM0_9GAMM|nr:molecular chaperone [Pragia fontium]SFD41829.1 fimbrial chaperone protein [Pragia fontium DSM 5563 = ATCC 49100]VEJ55495.1 Chaperone protein focC precursor [Pragia fontium]